MEVRLGMPPGGREAFPSLGVAMAIAFVEAAAFLVHTAMKPYRMSVGWLLDWSATEMFPGGCKTGTVLAAGPPVKSC